MLNQKKRILCLFLMVLVLLYGGPSNAAASATPVKPPVIVTFLDVGQADAILIQTKGAAMLIDAGNNEDSDLVIKAIKKAGIKKLDYVVGTHPHEDHIGGLDEVISAFEIGKVIMPKVTTNTATFKDVLNAIAKKKLKITVPAVGDKYKLGEAEITVLAPKSSKYEDMNDYSIVLRLVHGTNSFLFTGDAGILSEKEMIKAKLTLASTVLKVGHHGSTSSTSKDFLKAVAPKYAIISVGKDNDYGHPKKEIIDALVKGKVTLYRTDINGMITFTSDGKKLTTKLEKLLKAVSATGSVIVATPPVIISAQYIGNLNSHKFHLPTCKTLPLPENWIIFATRVKAVSAGYEPCGNCNP